MFFSEPLECSSFDKLLENVSESSRKMFAHFLEFARITSFVWNNPHSFPPDIWNAALTTLLKLLAKVWKFSTQTSGNNGRRIFFQEKFPDNFSAGDLECSFDQFVEKILSEVWGIRSLSQPVYLFIYFFLTYDLTDHENFLSKS